jgi:K+-transporting ATPase ATPase A chain
MANNGMNMAGLNANTVFYNITTIIPMLAGRYGLAALALGLAGEFAAQRRRPITAGSLPSDTPIFAVLVFFTIILVGALCFFPMVAIGPIVEFLQH